MACFPCRKWGGGNFSRPGGPYIKRWQELSDTLSLHRNSCHLPPLQIPSSLQQGGTLVPQPDHNAHLNLGPWCHPSGADALKSPELDGPSGARPWWLGTQSCQPAGATASPIQMRAQGLAAPHLQGRSSSLIWQVGLSSMPGPQGRGKTTSSGRGFAKEGTVGRPGELASGLARVGTALDSPSPSASSRAPGAQAAVPRGRKDRLGPCGPCRPSSALRSTAAKGTAGRGAGGHQAGWAASPLIGTPSGQPMRAVGKMEKVRPDLSHGASCPGGAQVCSRGRGVGWADKARAHLGMLKPLPGKDGVPTSPGVPGPPVCVSPPRAAVVASLASAAVARVGSPAGSLLPVASATPTVPLGLLTLGRGAHTPRRTALKWEPLRTVRAEPLALSRKTEVYCPACRGAPRSARTPRPTGPPTARPALPAHTPHPQTRHL